MARKAPVNAEFQFKPGSKEHVIRVFKGTREIGTLVRMFENSGRYCFRLRCDRRRKPRTYRGKQLAAEALAIVDALARESSRKDWSPQELVVQAWDRKPHSANN